MSFKPVGTALVIGLLVAIGLFLSTSVSAERAPNIILLIADDLGWGDVGYHGSEIQTPTLDSLAANGARLNRFYTYPACTQTRGALLSGHRMRTVGLLEPMPPWSDAGLPLELETLADVLQRGGYATWKIGKWHLGDHYLAQFPNARGFDHFYGFLSGEINYETHVFASSKDWQRNGVTIEEEGYSTHLLTDEAVRLIQSQPTDQPFFLDLSYNAPHTPLQAPQDSIDAYGHIEDMNRRRYAAMVSEMDAGIARVLEAVRARADFDNTFVLFMSDNGAMSMFGGSNKPLRGGKITHYEGGLRVPAIAYWPGVIDSGIREQVIGVHDVFPTLVALASRGASNPILEDSNELAGVDVWSVIASDAEVTRDEPLVFAMVIPGPPRAPAKYSASLISGDWKLIENYQFFRSNPPGERYQLLERELFNIDQDPLEQADQIAENVSLANRLSEQLETIPMGKPIGFAPPPKDWTLGTRPGAEPNFDKPLRPPLVDAAKNREMHKP